MSECHNIEDPFVRGLYLEALKCGEFELADYIFKKAEHISMLKETVRCEIDLVDQRENPFQYTIR